MDIEIQNNGKVFSNIKAILFDLDGTLINSLDLHISSFQWILKKLGREVEEKELENLMGLTPQDIIKNFFTNLPMDLLWKAATEKEEYLENLIEDVHVYPGIIEFLQKIQGKCRAIVISSTHGRLVEKLLHKAGIKNLVDDIVSGDEIKNGKPSPEPFLKGVSKAGVKCHEALGIGDSLFDAESCKNASIRFIGILTGKTERNEFLKFGIGNMINSISEITVRYD